MIHSFGRADQLDRAALERLVRSINRVLDGGDAAVAGKPIADIDIERVFEFGAVLAARIRRGHNKEGRDNQPQVIIALAVTRDGMPVRSWVLPGDTADVATVARIKDDLRA